MKTLPLTILSMLGIMAAVPSAANAAILANPTIPNSATAFNGSYVAENLFDGSRDSEYASQGQGVNTFVDMDFGSPKTMDRFFLITRFNTVDVVGQAQLILSNNADFSSPLATVTINPSGQNGDGLLTSFTATTVRYVRWDVITSTGGSENLGGIEMRFLNTPAGSAIAPATVINSAAAFNPDYAAANAANNNFGRDGSGREYAINGGATGANNMFVDFDLGATKPISGFDFFDRLAADDRTTQFDLIFSNDSSFASTIATQSYTTGSNWGFGQTFAPVNARYVRVDATNAVGNPGLTEMIFYSVPEPTGVMLTGLAGLLSLARRRRS